MYEQFPDVEGQLQEHAARLGVKVLLLKAGEGVDLAAGRQAAVSL